MYLPQCLRLFSQNDYNQIVSGHEIKLMLFHFILPFKTTEIYLEYQSNISLLPIAKAFKDGRY